MKRPAIDRFMEKIEVITETGCWIWTGGLWKDGYGQFAVRKGMSMGAHRVSYLLHDGELIDGLVLDHKCRVHCCVNPDHLEQVSSRENILRGVGEAALNSIKYACKRGHVFDDGNTYIAKNGSRKCRKCRVMHVTNYRLKRSAAMQMATTAPNQSSQ